MVIRENLYQTIEVSPKREISKQEIIKLIQVARRTRSYVKFTVGKGKFYIMVTFHRNGSVNLSSNIRAQSGFQRQLFWTEQRGFSEGVWAEFIYTWINKFAKDDRIY